MAWWMIAAALASAPGQQQDMAGMAGMQAAAPCPATPAPLPTEVAGWATMAPLTASATPVAAPRLALGSGAALTLLPSAGVTYAAAMKHPGAPGTFGGNVAFTVVAPGRYRVALGSGAWIDVARGDVAQTSIAHGKGPACTSLKKMVDFDLAPGAYVLQIAGNDAATLKVMVAKLPG